MASSSIARVFRTLAVGVPLAAAFALASTAASAAELAGSWAGGGSFALSSGTKERAHCRAHYSKTGAASYAMNASCATASARVDQSAVLRRTGANSFAGSFFNAQYGTGGSIFVTVNGASQSVSISGQAGSGHFSLRRL